MFQYALGRRLALERGASLWLDLRVLEEGYSTPRDYALDGFQIRASRIVTKSRASMFDKLVLGILDARPVTEIREHVLQKMPPGRFLYLSGFWHLESYFAEIANTLREEFQPKQPLSASRQHLAEQLGPDSVSIHVRRGDYIAVSEYSDFFGVCTPEWYSKAIALMESRLPNPRYVVFSDEIDWARSNLPLRGRSAQFVGPQPDQRDFEDIHLMSRCAHHIIANSTFSWWGAWLNPSLSKTIIAPKVWFKGAPDWKVDLPATWIRI
jgi:hypothetical protein